jgi:hypothetical protein
MKTLLTTLSLKAIPADWLHRVKVQSAREATGNRRRHGRQSTTMR